MNMPATRVPGTRVPIVAALAALRALLAVVFLVASAGLVVAGGSHEKVTPGYVAVMHGDRIARFDTRATTFKAYMDSHHGRLGVIE